MGWGFLQPLSPNFEQIVCCNLSKNPIFYSGDLINEHLNNKLLLVQYSDVWYSNGGPVFSIR